MANGTNDVTYTCTVTPTEREGSGLDQWETKLFLFLFFLINKDQTTSLFRDLELDRE